MGMAEIKEKHPTWFKMKAERRQLVRELPAETTAKVLLACWEYLETAEIPATLNPLERIAFSAFFPDLEESWRLYEQRIGTKIPPNNSERPSDTGRYHTMPHGTEPEPETEGRGESKEDSPSPALKNFSGDQRVYDHDDSACTARKPPCRNRWKGAALQTVITSQRNTSSMELKLVPMRQNICRWPMLCGD